MKKLFILFAFVLVTTLTFAQSRNSINEVTVDTIQGAETVTFSIFDPKSNYDIISITAVCDQLGGTSDGTLTLYGSFGDDDWVFINGVGGGVVTASPQASITGADLNQITITNTLVANWVVTKNPFTDYKIDGAGTTGDTTLVTIKYKFQ